MILGMTEDWVKRGEYYYFTRILKRKESADLFQKVTVPAVWGKEHSGQKLGIVIQAEAIQRQILFRIFLECLRGEIKKYSVVCMKKTEPQHAEARRWIFL